MNILAYFALGWGTLFAGYKFLRPSIEGVIQPDPNRKTAAVELEDGRDYVPANKAVLFGHHWMSIAGTSPIVAAIVGLAWGWVPAFLWMVLGVCLIGGVHDYFVTMISTRNKGMSMGEMLRTKIGKVSGRMSSLLLAFGGILVFAIFLFVISDTVAKTPTAVIPTLSLIPIAVVFGFMLRRGMNVALCSALCLAVIGIMIGIGLNIPIEIPFSVWIWFFAIYTLIAMYVPVWALLQPRDYLDSYVLIIALLLGVAGLLIARPGIQFPAFVGFVDGVGSRPLWPMLFATISCGAASGWHSLIAAGTTSKQLSNEKDGFPIAFGGMQAETLMALLASALIITSVSYADFAAVAGSPGPAFSAGLGVAISHLGFSPIVGTTIGALALAALTLTTMDSFARAGRYVLQEIGKGTILAHPLPSSVFVAAAGLFLYFSVPFMDLWAGLVLSGLLALIFPLAILLTERIRTGQPIDGKHLLHVVFPLAFVYITAFGALIYQLRNFITGGNYVAAAMVLFLLGIGAAVAVESINSLKTPLVKEEATVNA